MINTCWSASRGYSSTKTSPYSMCPRNQKTPPKRARCDSGFHWNMRAGVSGEIGAELLRGRELELRGKNEESAQERQEREGKGLGGVRSKDQRRKLIGIK